MILVFGKNGQVATELLRQANIFALGRDEADLSNPASCVEKILSHRPSIVINAAAYTSVDKAEKEEDLAMLINGEAPGAMARGCAELNIPFLHISTDYVFNGNGLEPWQIDSPVAPLNVYGRSKLLGEKEVMSAGANSAILRTSWIFSSHGTNFVNTMLRLANSNEVINIVNDQIGGPTPADKIAEALLKMAYAMQQGQKGGIYHYSGSPYTNWSEFASEIFHQSGKKISGLRIPTSDYTTLAKRPLNSRLDCTKITQDFEIETPDWKAGLVRILNNLEINM